MFEETEKCGSYPREQTISEDLSKVIQRLELPEKDFKTAIINILSEVKQNKFPMSGNLNKKIRRLTRTQ